MAELLQCPACPGAPALSQLRAGLPLGGLHRCAHCMGVLAAHAAVAEAKKQFASPHPLTRPRPVAHRCRACGRGASVGAARCAHCAASLVLRCPRCTRSMLVLDVLGIVVDVCRGCELTFFDAGEFVHACNAPRAFVRALRLTPPPPAPAQAGTGASIGLGDAVAFAPLETLEVIGYGAHAAGHVALAAASHVAGTAAHVDLAAAAELTGTVALGAAHAATEAASSAGETILEVLASIFG
jgi:TFIIB-like protein